MRVMEEAHIHPAGTHGVVAGRRGTIIGHSVIEDHVLDARPQLVYIVRFDHGHGAYLRESDSHGPCYISTLVADPSSFNADADDREHWDETDEVGW